MTDNTPLSPREARAQARGAKAQAKALRPFYQKKRFIIPGVIVAVVVIASVANSGKNTPKTASDPFQTVASPATVVETTVASPPAAANGKPNDKGFVVESSDFKQASYGNAFAGTARITNANDTAKTATFTFTLFVGGKQVAALIGSVNDVAAGKTVTVELVSQDAYVPGPYKTDFQTDTSF